MIDVHALRKSSSNTSDWLIGSIDTDKDAIGNASAATTSANSSASPNAKSKRRVLLSERCAYTEGVWDETPEDVLRSLSLCTVLCGSLISVIASRLLVKCDALVDMQKNAGRLWAAAANLQSVLSGDANQRHVMVQVGLSVEFNGLALLNPSFLPRSSKNRNPTEAVGERVTSLSSALRSVCAGGSSGGSVLWKVLICAATHFSSSEVLQAMDGFVSDVQVWFVICC